MIQMKRFNFKLLAYLIAANMPLFSACKGKDIEPSKKNKIEKSGEVVLNPGQGWILYGTPGEHNAATIALATTGYDRYDWSEINPRENVYDWSSIDDAIKRWAQNGKQFSFGIMSVNIFGDVYCTPKWVFDKGANYTMGNGENESGSSSKRIYYIPVWDDPVYVEACKKFAEALAERYDGNPNIAFIDIRNYGNWGEMHMYPFEKYTEELSDEKIQSLLFKPYLDNFKNIKLVICEAGNQFSQWAVNNGIGLRSDGIMGQVKERNASGSVLAPAIGKEPVVWEFWGGFRTFENNREKPWDDDRFIKIIKDNKPNYIGMGHWDKDAQYMLSKKPELVRKVANLMGFNFSVTTASYHNMKFDEPQEVSLSIENSGVTVMLTDCVIKLVLLGSNEEVVSSFKTNWNAKSINGGSTMAFKANVVFTDTPEGNYKLAIGLYRNENDPNPTYNMDNKVRTKDGFYVIGAMRIE